MALEDRPTNAMRWGEADIEAKFAPASARMELLNARAEEQRKRGNYEYGQQKRGMLGDQLFFGAIGAAGEFAFGDLNALLSFGVGSAAGFAYLFLLQRTVDAVGDEEAGLRKGPAPIIAVILLMGMIAKNHLAVFPALFGFGTYKISTIAQALVPTSPSDKRKVGR
ncbi:hypothetical protein T492DRAFT_1068611 [Pavlovales sp. CCMP2436]|nr:hypothetical protein T492DRAFT_1068611 [Pavlovales sp. CCMP2436]